MDPKLNTLMLTVSYQDIQGTYSFWANDSHERYLANLNTQPADWYYRTHTVTYKINAQGYRTAEFNTFDWTQAIVLFGDELAWGQGLDEADTIARALSIHTERPVINLSQPAASPEWVWAQHVEVKQQYEPWATVTLWPSSLRATSWAHALPEHQGHWTHHEQPERERRTRSQRASRAAQQLWNRQVNLTLDSKEAWLLNAQPIDTNINTLDRSRDGSIPGKNAAQLIAQMIAHKL